MPEAGKREDFLTRDSYIVSVEIGANIWVYLTIPCRPRRLARPRTPPSHGDNTSSNLVGDAK